MVAHWHAEADHQAFRRASVEAVAEKPDNPGQPGGSPREWGGELGKTLGEDPPFNDRFDIASGSSAPEPRPSYPAQKDPGGSVDRNYDAKSTEGHRRGTSRDPALPPQRSNLSRSARPPGPLDLAQAPRKLIFSSRQMPPIDGFRNARQFCGIMEQMHQAMKSIT